MLGVNLPVELPVKLQGKLQGNLLVASVGTLTVTMQGNLLVVLLGNLPVTLQGKLQEELPAKLHGSFQVSAGRCHPRGGTRWRRRRRRRPGSPASTGRRPEPRLGRQCRCMKRR